MPRNLPPGGKVQVPTESSFHCPIIFLWILPEGENVRNALRDKVDACSAGQPFECLCSSAKEKQKLYCKLTNPQDALSPEL